MTSPMKKLRLEAFSTSPFLIIFGILLGASITIAPFIRLSEGRTSGVDWVLIIGGLVIAAFWILMSVLRWRGRRDSPEDDVE